MRKRRNRPVSKLVACGLIGTGLGGGAALGGATSRPSPGVQQALAQLTASVAMPPTAPAPTPKTQAGTQGVAEPDGSLYTTSGSWPALAHLAHPVVGWVSHPGGGAWEVSSDGGVFSRGGAPFHGSAAAAHLTEPVVGMAATPSGGGYWLLAADGGVFSFGDARFHGSMGGRHLTKPVVGIAATPTGDGYWLVAADGGVFSFGDAGYHGSTGKLHLSQPVVGMASTSSGNGYWLVAADGGVFAFGGAGFHGSAVGRGRAATVSVDPAGTGYDEVQGDGSIWAFRPGAAPTKSRLAVAPSEVAAAQAVQASSRAVSVALSQVGKPYVWGAAGPAAFDCSGLTQYAYHQAGVNLPRSTAQQLAATKPVSAADLRPGDLVFFYPGITHVGIYLGDGMMVDAPHTGAAVRVESIEWFGPLMGATRPTA